MAAIAALNLPQRSLSGHRPLFLLGLMSLFMVPLVWAEPFSPLWLADLFIAALFTTFLSAQMGSRFPQILKDTREASRSYQLLNVLALGAAMTAGPILIEYGGLIALIATILLVSLINYPFIKYYQHFPIEEPASPRLVPQKANSSVWKFLFINVLAWSGIGTFNIIEVPMLTQRFSGGSALITSVFVVTLLCNFLTARFFSKEFLSKPESALGLSILGLFLVSLFYLNNFVYFLIFASVAAFGILNSVYNMAQFSILFSNESEEVRKKLILFVRLSSQVGIMVSAGTIFLLNHLNLPLYTHLTYFIVFLACLLIFILYIPRFRLAPYVLLIASFYLPQNGATAAEAPKFRVGVYSIPEHLDPASVMDLSAALINRQVFHFLYRFNSDNELEPELVESHTISNNGLVYKIILRSDFKFSDGSPVRAKDVVWTINRIVRKDGRGSAWALSSLKGYSQSVESVKKVYVPIEGVVAKNEHEVVLTLTSPFRDFLQILATPYFGIVKAGTPDDRNVILSDQYLIKRSSAPEQLELVPSATNPLQGKISSLQFLKVNSQAEGLKETKEQNLDWFFPVDPSITIPLFKTVQFDSLNVVVLQVNTQRGYFRSADNRCRFTSAFAEIVEQLPNIGRKIKLGLPFTTGVFNIRSNSQRTESPVSSSPAIHLNYIDSVAIFSPEDLHLVQVKMKDFGFRIQFSKMLLSQFLNYSRNKDFQAVLWGYGIDYFSPDALLSPLLVSGQKYNFSNFSNSYFDRAIFAGRSSLTDNTKASTYEDIFATIRKECPLGFLGVQRSAFLLNTKYQIARPSSIGIHTVVLAKGLKVVK